MEKNWDLLGLCAVHALTDAELAEQLAEHSWPQSSELARVLDHEYSERLGRELLASCE